MVVFRFFPVGDCMCLSRYYRAFSSLILALSLVFVPVIEANAQATVAASRMSSAIAGLVRAKAARWGFAANDPRIAATIVGIETGLTIAAVGGSSGGVITWPVLLGAVGIGSIVAGSLYLMKKENSSYTWNINANGTILTGGVLPNPGTQIVGDGNALVENGAYAQFSIGRWDANKNQTVYDNVYVSHSNVKNVAIALNGGQWGACNGPYAGDPYIDCTIYSQPYPEVAYNSRYRIYAPSSGSPVSSSSGVYDGRSPPPPIAVTPVTYADIDKAAKAVPQSIKSENLPVESLAAAANAVWKAAANANQSGGVPWSASDPITPQEVSDWVSANAGAAPTVGDFLGAPAQTPSTSGGPSFSLGGGSSGTAPGGGGSTNPNPTNPEPAPEPVAPTTPGSGQEIDWGPNPNIGAPGLETTPTAASILDPIFSLMPTLKNWSVPNHQAECPVASFSAYGRDYVMDAHCGMMEQNRGVIGAAMVLVFSLLSLFIVLRA